MQVWADYYYTLKKKDKTEGFLFENPVLMLFHKAQEFAVQPTTLHEVIVI